MDKGEQGEQRLGKRASKAERMDAERAVERREGLSPERRGSVAAPSDKAEGAPPHPQDVNEIGEPS